MRYGVKRGMFTGAIVGGIVWLLNMLYTSSSGLRESALTKAICDFSIGGSRPFADIVCTATTGAADNICRNLVCLVILVLAGALVGGIFSYVTYYSGKRA